MSNKAQQERNSAVKRVIVEPLSASQALLSISHRKLVLQQHLMNSGRGKDGNVWSLQDLQHASPTSLLAPALIATDHRLPGSEALGKVPPRRTGAHDPEDGLDDLTMLNCRTSGGGLRRQEGKEVVPSLC